MLLRSRAFQLGRARADHEGQCAEGRCVARRDDASIQVARGGVRRRASVARQDAAGAETGATAFGGWVPSDLRRFLPLAVLRTCLAEMVLLPTRFFFASAISILLSKEAEDTCGVAPGLPRTSHLTSAVADDRRTRSRR